MAIRRARGARSRDPLGVRERILSAFSERATRAGIRAVLMSELASELRMSASTLYNHFPSKEELVRALVERWADDVAVSEVAIAEHARSRSAVDGMVHWAEAWAGSVSHYGPAFWEDLRRDHPEAWSIFQRKIATWKEAGAALLRPHLRADLHPEMALEVLDLMIARAPDPRICDRLGISRQEAIRTALRIWAQGALKNQGRLAVLGGPGSTRGPRARSRRAPQP
jgi:AcrR family transcriptional regulator